MRGATRQAILAAANALFRERGYTAVSVGEIAHAVGISKGNLTYYFPRKENLLEALLTSGKPTFPPQPPETLAQLDACLADMEQARSNNAFYFRSHAQLGQLSERILATQQRVYRHHSALLGQGLKNLQAKGLVRAEAFPGEYARAVDGVFLTTIYWLPFAAIKGGDPSFRAQAWAIFHPLLTPAGQQELAALLPDLWEPSPPHPSEKGDPHP